MAPVSVSVPSHAEAVAWLALEGAALDDLCAEADAQTRTVHGDTISVVRNIFLPAITHCRDDCSYCTFKQEPPHARVMSPDEVLALARVGRTAGCTEALFVTGDRPEAKYEDVRVALAQYGVTSTPEYLHMLARLVRDETGLLPHVNCGVLTAQEMTELKAVTGSLGLMLENVSDRLRVDGEVHRRSPDKRPARRLAMLEAGATCQVALTSGLLIGIGETPEEIIDTLFALHELATGGQVQEIIVQNFRAKPNTRMAGCQEPDITMMRRVLAAARLICGPVLPIQAPPNLTPDEYGAYLACGITDWGGVSPVTIDHVNPEAPWPALDELQAVTEGAGFRLRERLTLYPDYVLNGREYVHPDMAPFIDQLADAEGFAKPPRL